MCRFLSQFRGRQEGQGETCYEIHEKTLRNSREETQQITIKSGPAFVPVFLWIRSGRSYRAPQVCVSLGLRYSPSACASSASALLPMPVLSQEAAFLFVFVVASATQMALFCVASAMQMAPLFCLPHCRWPFFVWLPQCRFFFGGGHTKHEAKEVLRRGSGYAAAPAASAASCCCYCSCSCSSCCCSCCAIIYIQRI